MANDRGDIGTPAPESTGFIVDVIAVERRSVVDLEFKANTTLSGRRKRSGPEIE
jgi:hypothetical protein